MPLVALPAIPPAIVSREERVYGWTGNMLLTRDLLNHDPTRIEFTRFTVGEIKYCSPKPLLGTFEPPIHSSDGRFLVAEFAPEVVGRGRTLKKARQDWQFGFDREVQRILALQDFEMTEADKRIARKIHRYFDLNELRYATPLKLRTYGRILRIRGHRYQVRWIDGQTNWLTRNEIPSSMLAFRVGQAFEAVVRRNPRTWNLLRIESAFPSSALPELTQEEADKLFSATKASLRVEQLEWD